jgi:hypothetical protein
MSVNVECDRCGFQEQTSGVMLFAGLTGPAIPTARPELPDGWTRPALPTEDGELRKQELCPGCKADLFRFMAGARVVDVQPIPVRSTVCRSCGHASHDKPCRELTMPGAPGDVDECGCLAGVDTAEALSEQLCPDCGHLRHSDPCPDHVSEVGPCGCKSLTPRNEMERLGVDD